MGKRKRNDPDNDGQPLKTAKADKVEDPELHSSSGFTPNSSSTDGPLTVQIVAGSYERILHGFTATLNLSLEADQEKTLAVDFADTFLFTAHSSSIRCLAHSPLPTKGEADRNQKVILASGSTDERIHLYHLSASPPSAQKGGATMPALGDKAVMENPRNRELGVLLHHASAITGLHFPTRGKLLSAAEDNTIAITRTRDWTMLSTIKAPFPRAQGRPSGDTAPSGGIPSGINEFAAHPSMKLMLSVSKGERCMRLWNLVTGKKAGVLNFGKEILQAVGESKRSSGEGRKVDWSPSGEEFVIGFERGAVVYALDCKPKCRVLPSPPSKIHQVRYVSLPEGSSHIESTDADDARVLALSTEDGRVILYSTASHRTQPNGEASEASIPYGQVLGEVGGKAHGVNSRIKDFKILNLPRDEDYHLGGQSLLIVTASSDGAIRLWSIKVRELLVRGSQNSSGGSTSPDGGAAAQNGANGSKKTTTSARQVGKMLGVYESGNRITCMTAFIMARPSDHIPGNDAVSEPAMPLNGDGENPDESDSS